MGDGISDGHDRSSLNGNSCREPVRSRLSNRSCQSESFDFINKIADIFEPLCLDSGKSIKFNRSTFSFIAKNQALKTIKDTAGISPYPIIPHTALIHNEELVGITEKEK